jgi:hypothetical protein
MPSDLILFTVWDHFWMLVCIALRSMFFFVNGCSGCLTAYTAASLL